MSLEIELQGNDIIAQVHTGSLVRQLYWRKSSLRLQRWPISSGKVVNLLLDKFREICTSIKTLSMLFPMVTFVLRLHHDSYQL